MGVENSDGCMEVTRSRSRISSSESSRAPIRVCRARVLLSADADESVAWWWVRTGFGNWATNASNGSEDSMEEVMESCMRSLPLAFGDFSSACESDLDRIYSCEPKKGLCILLLTSLSWADGSTTSADGPSYWTTSAVSHLWDWSDVASGVGMADNVCTRLVSNGADD